MHQSKVVFLDRDGTINEERGYLNNPKELILIDGSLEAIRILKKKGFKIIIITNQSGISRGFFSEDDLKGIHKRLIEILDREGIALDGIYYCPHRPEEGCDCRKPKTGLIRQAANELGLDTTGSYMVGDKTSDIELAHNSRTKGVLVLTGYGMETLKELESKSFKPYYVARDLLDAVRWIIKDCDALYTKSKCRSQNHK